MKFLVDALPKKCKDCQYRADAVAMSPLGVQKQVVLCMLQTALIPPTDPGQEPNFLDEEKSPAENMCPCKGLNDTEEENIGNVPVKSSLILD